MEKEHLADVACECLQLDDPAPDMKEWQEMVNTLKHLEKDVTVALVGKYTTLHDAYISVVESLKHGGLAHKSNVTIKWVPSEEINEENAEHKVPYLGLCLGMQVAIIEFARHVCGFNDAHSIELDPQTTHPVIHLMADQDGVEDIGGTLRLGAYPCVLAKDSLAHKVYGTDQISERHRHRYEVNNYYREDLEKNGMLLSGLSPDGRIVEMCEIPSHPWFIATQAHPEFKSRPNRPHPLFKGFIGAALEYQEKNK